MNTETLPHARRLTAFLVYFQEDLMLHRKTFVELPHAEQQEFQDCCERRRYNRKQFKVISNEAHELYRTVTVMHQGKERHYMACEDKNWLADFDSDLAAGYFGTP